MPKITLRLSDEQHDELVSAARRNERSVQREIVYRCFGVPLEEQLKGVALGGLAHGRHFRPDPKPGKK